MIKLPTSQRCRNTAWLMLLWLLTGPAVGQPAPTLDCAPYTYLPANPELPQPRANSFLLRVQVGEDSRPSFILATYHEPDRELLAQWRVVLPLMARQAPRRVIVERDFQQEAIDRLVRVSDPVHWRIAGLAAAADAAMQDQRHEGRASEFAPWYLATALMPVVRPSSASVAIDVELLRFARHSHWPVQALETFDELAAGYSDQVSDQQQQRLLAETLCNPVILQHSLAAQREAYQANDVEAFYRAQTRWRGQDEALARLLEQVFVQQRNQRFNQLIVPQLAEGGIVVAVGNLHVFGEQGLLQAIRRSLPAAAVEAVDLSSLPLTAETGEFETLSRWVNHWLDTHSYPARVPPMLIRSMSERQLQQHLCPGRLCKVDATVANDEIWLEYGAFAQLLLQSGDSYAESLLIRDMVRVALAASQPVSACHKRQQLHLASLAQRDWGLQSGMTTAVVLFPPQQCASH